MERLLFVIFFLVIATLVVAPFYLAQRKYSPGNEVINVISYHDLVEHIVVMEQFDKVLRSGVLYPRWLADMNNGYGNAWTNFYPPGFYYLTSSIHFVVDDWLTTLFIASVLALGASGVAMYVLSRTFYGALASGVAALLYMLLPFHLLNLYWQGAMPQFTGFVFLPLVLYFAFRLGKEGRARHYAGLGLVYGFYVVTHLPVSYLMSYALAFYAVIWAVTERDWKIAVRLVGGMAIGILLSAIYWLPALLEAKYAYENVSAMFPYHSGYLLLLPPGDIFANILNHAFMLQALLLLVAIVILRSTRGCEASTTVQTQNRLFIIMGIATTLMVTSLSIYPSMLIPRIEVAAFPWRWIAVASVFTSLLAGAAAERLARPDCLDRKKLWASCAAIVAVVMLNLWITVQFVVIRPMSNPTIKSTVGLLESNYTPKDATPPTALPNSAPVTVHPGGGASEIVRWEPQYRKIALRVDQPSQLRLKTYNFPGWTARIDGEKVPLSSDQDGVQLISVPPGIHNIEVEFVDTKPRRLGAMLFGLGLFIIAGLGALDYRQRRTWRTLEAKAKTDAEPESNTEPDNGAKALHATRRALTVKVSIVVASVVIVALILAGWLSTRSKSSSSMEGKQGTTRSGQARSGISTGVGSEVRLYLERLTSVPVAADERAFDELITALSTRRQDSVETLIQSGRVFRADNDTRIRILEMASGKVKVRVLEGPHIMKDGWIHEGWVR